MEKYDFVGFENIEGDIAMKDLPTTWKDFSIEDLMEAIIDYRGKTPAKTTSGIPLITAKIIDNGKIHTPTEFISQETYVEWMKRGFPKKGDVLITTEAPLGEVAQLYDDKVALAQRVILLRGRSDKLSNSYLKWVLQSSQTQKQLYSRSTGSTVLGIKQSELRKVKIPLPPLNEQKRIAAILDKADAIRRKRKQAIALTEDLLRSAFLEMFGDPVTNPKGWKVKKLWEVTNKITDGVHSRPKYTEQGIPFISVKDITTGELKFDDCKFISEEDHQKYIKRCKPELGDILYTKVGATYGRPALVSVTNEFSLYVSVCLIKPRKELILPEFLKETLATPAVKLQADRSIKGIGVPDLHLNMIKEFVVPVPPIPQQKDFLNVAHKIRSSKKTLQSFLDESEDLFNSLLQRAFRGEL